MTGSSLLQKGKELWNSITSKETVSPDKEEISESLQEVDAKLVFQDTKKSLESLKQHIFTHTDIEKRKEREQHILQYVDRLLGFSALEQTDKNLLVAIKNNLSRAQESDIETIILVVSHLEKKAEHLTEVDKEKVRELNETLFKHRQFLSHLKEGVNTPVPTLEEAKKQTFDTLKKKLEEHRWSAWLAQPVYDYLVEKHINKKAVSKFKDWLMGTVGLTIVGWFVGKELRKLLENIDTLSVEDILDSLGGQVEKVQTTLADLAPEKFEAEKKRLEDMMFPFFEKQLGRSLDRTAFTAVCHTWLDKWKGKIALSEKWETASEARGGNGEFDLFGETVGLLVAPPIAVFDFVVQMQQAGILTWNDIVIDGILLPSGKAILKLGIGSVGLFANTMKTVFTSMSAEELSEYIKEHSDRLDVDSKLALWGLLYRRGGWFWNLAGHIGSLLGEGLSTLFMQRTGGDVGKISAYWKGGVMANFEKELQVFKQLENSLTNTSIFGEIKTTSGASVLDDMISTMKKNMSVFDIVRNGDSFSSIESALKNQGFDDVLTDLKNSVHWGKDLAKVKTVTGNIIETNMNKSLFLAEDSFSTWRKFFGNKVKLPWSKFPYEVELIQKMRDFSKLQGKMLQSDAMFNNVRNLFRNFKKGKLLAGMVEYSDDIKFTLSNVDDAKHFFDNVRTIGRRFPEILKTLFKGFPLIMMGREIMDKLSDPTNNEPAINSIRDGFMYLTPLVGPIKLISDGLTIKDGNFVSLSSAGVGLGLFTIDGYFALKSLPKKEFIKFMTMPIRDSVSFIKSMAKGTYLSLKMLADGVRIIRAGKTAELGVQSLRLLKSSGLNIASFALLFYLGYEVVNNFFDDASEEEKKQLAEIEKMDKTGLEAKIKKDWPTMTDEQKSTLIKLATIQRMGLTDITKVDTQKQGNTIAIRFGTLVNYHAMKEVEQDLQISLGQLEATKDIRLDFTLDGGEIKYELLDWKKSKFLDDTGSFDQEAMRNYLMTMGYSLELTEKLLETIA